MSVLVLIEHDGSQVKDATLATITAASKLGEVHALVVGNNVEGVAQAAARIAGVAKVHVASSAALEHQLAEAVAPVAAKLMDGHDAFLARGNHDRKEYRAARRRLARRHADQRRPFG